MKPMATPATPRSRIKSTNPVNCPRICSRISLFCSINGLIDKTVGFRNLRSRDVDECNVWEVRDQKIVHFYILRPEGFLFHLILVGELALDELAVHADFYLPPRKAAFFRFRERKNYCFILRPVVSLISQELFQFNFLSPILNDNTRSCRPRIIPRPAIRVDNDSTHYRASYYGAVDGASSDDTHWSPPETGLSEHNW